MFTIKIFSYLGSSADGDVILPQGCVDYTPGKVGKGGSQSTFDHSFDKYGQFEPWSMALRRGRY